MMKEYDIFFVKLRHFWNCPSLCISIKVAWEKWTFESIEHLRRGRVDRDRKSKKTSLIQKQIDF